jgi:4-phosphopantoate--beta-alanine ligase
LIPKDHPRRASLEVRDKLVECFRDGIVAEQGLIAHGRGEAFDYLLGEKTSSVAVNAIKAAVAAMFLADNPVISVNGNLACLCSKDIVKLAELTNAKLEINLFYRSKERIKAIADLLKRHNAKEIYGIEPKRYVEIEELSSNRRIVDRDGVYSADLVLVPLEDGDRTEALVKINKRVITIDLNPLSRTAKNAHISIIDNVTRAMPLMVKFAREYNGESINFDNRANLEESLKIMRGLL